MNTRRLEDKTIIAWVGEAAYRRGKRYVQEGRVLHPRREDKVLLAQCRGQAIEPYRVRVRLGKEGILAARCTCPVGVEGRCKHVAATLLLWQHHAEAFRPLPPLIATLQKWNKKALVALIVQMIERDPDLRELIHPPSESFQYQKECASQAGEKTKNHPTQQ